MDLQKYWNDLEDERKAALLTHVREMIKINHGVTRYCFLRTNVGGNDIRLRYDKSVDRFISIYHRLTSWDIPVEFKKVSSTTKSKNKSVGEKSTKKKKSKK